MKTVRNILESKEITGVYTISSMAVVFEAIASMSAHSVAALVVVENDKVIGMISERECMVRVALRDLPLKSTHVYEVMDETVQCFTPATSLNECMTYMTENRKRHVPVVDDTGKLIGLVSIGDVVKEYIATQAFTIDQLQSYIAG